MTTATKFGQIYQRIFYYNSPYKFRKLSSAPSPSANDRPSCVHLCPRHNFHFTVGTEYTRTACRTAEVLQSTDFHIDAYFHIFILDANLPSLCCITGDNRNYRVNTTFITADCKSKCVCTHDAYLACIPLCPKAILKCPVGFIQQIVSKPIRSNNQICYCPKYECVPIQGSGMLLYIIMNYHLGQTPYS
jgi:hypothetical protein